MFFRLAAILLLSIFPAAYASASSPEPAVVLSSESVDVDESTPVPIPEPTPRAVAFHRSGNVLWVFARLWDIAVPFGLLVTGASAKGRDLAKRIGRNWFFTVGIYVVVFLLIVFLLDLPLRYYAGYLRLHEYGLSRQSFGKWFGNSVIHLLIDMLGAFLVAWVPFLLIARFPRSWWLVTSLLMIPFLAIVMLITPVMIDTLFNDFRPMSQVVDKPNRSEAVKPIDRRALEARILELAGRAGIRAEQVFEVNKSVDTVAVNAYVTGLLGTHRIVLWDTMLAKLDEKEIVAIMGHEMGHYVLGHVGWTIVMSSVIVLAGLFFTDRVGRRLVARYHRRFGFDSLADVAATPLLLVLIGLSSTALAPVAMAYSRFHEHEADRFSLELTHMNRSSARAFADLQRENLGVPRHAWIYKIWRATHPSIAERIGFCNEYRPWAVSAVSASPRSRSD